MKFKSFTLALWLASGLPLSHAGLAAGFAAYAKSDYEVAIKEFQPAAEKGDARAQVKLGQMFRSGRGVKSDAVQSEKWLRLAANQGNPIAQYEIGRDLVNGAGNQAAEGLKLLQSSAEQNNINAMSLLGVSYAEGRGTPTDATEAIKWFSKAASRGDKYAQFELDIIAAKPGVERGLANFNRSNYSSAMEELKPFAEKGDARAQYALGVMYEYGDPWVRQDKALALKWIQLAFNQNNADAQLWFASNFEKNPSEKLRLYRLSAAQGNAKAMFWLGNTYEFGQYGVDLNLNEAMTWYVRAATAGDPLEQFSVGEMYAQGKVVPVDLVEAAKWYAMAARKGLPMALSKLGDIYAKGVGVPKDRTLAIAWYTKAIDSDSIDAQRGLADLLGD